jgi:hypothetical protein
MPTSSLVWDSKPSRKESPINWVELKTSAQIRNERDMIKYERKLLKFWAQSFLLGVPKIIVGFRDENGICHSLEELDTASIPGKVLNVGRRSWDGNVCINFTGAFLECECSSCGLIAALTHTFQGLRRLSIGRGRGEFGRRRSLRSSRSIKLRNKDMAIFSRRLSRPGDRP